MSESSVALPRCDDVSSAGPPGGTGSHFIPWQQLEPVPDAAPGTWMSRGVDPQFLVPGRHRGGWFRIRFKMAMDGRARVEIRVDTGHGFRAVGCIERTSFTGAVDRQFFVNVPQPVHGFRFDPLDMEGQFRLETLQIQPVTRFGLLSRALWAAFRQARLNGPTFLALANGLKSLLRGRPAEIKKKLLANIRGPSPLAPPVQDQDRVYQAWRHRRQLTAAARARMMAEATGLSGAPRISILVPLSTNSAQSLRPALASVLRQLYPRWELCIAGHDSMAASVRSILEPDARIKICFDSNNRDRASALNSALALAAGDYCALLDPEDEVADEALFRVAQVLTAEGPFDLLYTDEDRIEPTGEHVAPFFKPDWSPEYLLSLPYTGSLSVYRTDLLRELGGFREAFEPAEEYDLALRVAARAPRVRHLAEVLYHRRRPCTSAEAAEAGRRALASYLEQTGRPGSVAPGPDAATQRVRFAIRGRPKISIIIPTAYRCGTFDGERTTYLARCLTSIRTKTTYSNYEILLFDNDQAPPEILEVLARWQVHGTPYRRPFNWAATMNRGATLARGTHLLFLDDDTEVITPDWLECLLEYSQQPGIGAVGSRLHYPDGRLQHAGIAIVNGGPGHPFAGYPEDHPGYFLSSMVPRNWSAVTGACLMTRAEVFHTLGGFTENFAYYFNDVDYCLKVTQSGRRVVCNPHARLVHYETVTKSAVIAGEQRDFQELWKQRRPVDPFYNANFSTRFYDFRLEPE